PHPTYKFVGPVAAWSDLSYIGYFVGHANPAPDVVSWHSYSCSSSESTSACMDVAQWQREANATHNTELSNAGRTWPYMITEWNFSIPCCDPRYQDATLMQQFINAATAELSSLAGGSDGLVYAYEYAVTGSYPLINGSNGLTAEGQAWQHALAGTS